MKNPKQVAGILLLIISLAVFLFGYVYLHEFCFYPVILVGDFYANISAELASIAITILIIDFLSERRANNLLLQQLCREMSSQDKGFSQKAIKELKAHGWLSNGSLKGIDLSAANLSEANLNSSNLQEAILIASDLSNSYLEESNLKNAKMKGVNLKNAKLKGANLEGADLRLADLTDVDFTNTNLKGADLKGAILEGTTFSKDQLVDIEK